MWGENVDFGANPEKLEEAKYSVRSALWLWKDRALFSLANGDMTFEASRSITARISKGERGAPVRERWNRTMKIWNGKQFEKVCFNTTSQFSNP